MLWKAFMMHFLLWICLILFFVSLFLWLSSFLCQQQQNRMLYYPDMPPESRIICADPQEMGIPNAEQVSIKTADGVNLEGFILWPGVVTPPISSLAAAQDTGHGGFDAAVKSVSPSSPSLSPSITGPIGAVEMGGKKSSRGETGGLSHSNSGSSHAATTAAGLVSYPMLLYFHGNAGNVGHRLPLAQLLVAHLGCAVMMVDYRGFGRSDNAEIDQEGLELDAQACFDFIWRDPRVERDRIAVMGTSLGGAVAIYLASREAATHRISALIVENSFLSISAMVSTLGQPIVAQAVPRCPNVAAFLFNHYFKPLMLRIGWRSDRAIRCITTPILFLSGSKDELVPAAQMAALYKISLKSTRGGSSGSSSSIPMRRFVEFEEGTHNTLPVMPGYVNAIRSFLDEVRDSQSVAMV